MKSEQNKFKTWPNDPATGFDDKEGFTYNGLSKREYFAAHSDIPWNACLDALAIKGIQNPTNKQVAEYRAILKVLEADLLIEFLNKPKLKHENES